MAIQITVKAPQGAGKTNLIRKIEELLRADSNYSGEIHYGDGEISQWAKGSVKVVIQETNRGPI